MGGSNEAKKELKKLKEFRDRKGKLSTYSDTKTPNNENEKDHLKSQVARDSQACEIELGEKMNMTTTQMIHEMKSMDQIIKCLKKQLNEALSKQHEAMSNAVRLAKKNRQLESELQEVDRLAIAVEEECNTTMKGNLEKVSSIKEKLDESLHKVYHLEKKNAELKEQKNEMEKMIDVIKNHKKEAIFHLKKALEEKDNALKAVMRNEKELIKKIEKMTHTLQNQKLRIIDLENKLKNNEVSRDKSNEPNYSSQRICIKMTKPTRSSQGSEKDFNELDHRFSETTVNMRNQKTVTRVEIEESNPPSNFQDKDNKLTESCEELTQEINLLENNFCTDKSLGVRKHSRSSSPVRSISIKNIMAKLEKERDLAKADVERLQEEVDSLRGRLQMATEVRLEEKSRFERSMAAEEERVRELEKECRHLHKNQGMLRGKVEVQAESISKLKEYLQMATEDLKREENLNKQYKSLQEKTERALHESQEQAAQLEEELKFYQQQINAKEMAQSEEDSLRREIMHLQETIAKLGHEKENLRKNVESVTEETKNFNRKDEMQEEIREIKKKLSIQDCENNQLERLIDIKEEKIHELLEKIHELRDDLSYLKQDNNILKARNMELNTKLNDFNDEILSLRIDMKDACYEYKNKREHDTANLRRQLEKFQTMNARQKENIASLEKLLSSKREELMQYQLSNQQLQLEVERLQNLISDLKRNLDAETAEVEHYQKKAQKLCNQLEEVRRDTSRGRQQSRILLEKYTISPRSRSPSTPTRTKVIFETEGNLCQPSNRQENVKIFSNTKDEQKSTCYNSLMQGTKIPGRSNQAKSSPRTSQKQSCSFKTGKHSYNVEFDGNRKPKLTVKNNGDTTYRMRQYVNHSSKSSPRMNTKLSKENNDISRTRKKERSCSPSSQVHFHASLPSGSEVSVQLEEQEDNGGVEYYSYHSSSS